MVIYMVVDCKVIVDKEDLSFINFQETSVTAIASFFLLKISCFIN